MILLVYSTVVCDFKMVFDLTVRSKETYLQEIIPGNWHKHLHGDFPKLTSCNAVTTYFCGGSLSTVSLWRLAFSLVLWKVQYNERLKLLIA